MKLLLRSLWMAVVTFSCMSTYSIANNRPVTEPSNKPLIENTLAIETASNIKSSQEKFSEKKNTEAVFNKAYIKNYELNSNQLELSKMNQKIISANNEVKTHFTSTKNKKNSKKMAGKKIKPEDQYALLNE